jgi:hypothetical protein
MVDLSKKEIKTFFKKPKGPGRKKDARLNSRPGDDPEHVKNIMKLPCCVTGSMVNVDPHHLKMYTDRGTAKRAEDRYCVPLSHDLHFFDLELKGSKNEESWFAKKGINPWELANALWGARNDFKKMQQIMAEHLERIGVKVSDEDWLEIRS